MKVRRVVGIPFSLAYGFATQLRNSAFDHQYLAAKGLPVPVISVGNITAGGTGKTPVVLELRRHFNQKSQSVGILSRGYGRSGQGIEEVTLDPNQYFGDEPTLYKQIDSSQPVFVGPSRFEVGLELLKTYSPAVVIADDGFQHRSLARDLDLVLIDATQPLDDYRLLPAGLGREGLRGLLRADFLILTKTELPGALTKASIQDFLRSQGVVIADEKWVESRFHLGTPVPLTFGAREWPRDAADVSLISAIGRPKTFEKMVESQLNVRFKKHFIFRDHHDYQEAEVAEILKTAPLLLTTEKDAVKLKRLKIPLDRVYSAPLRVEFGSNKEKLYESLDRLSPARP